jgi:hypothetical protein
MVDCNHSVTDATLGLQWHVIAMYAPSFFTGSLIVRYGAERVIAAGFILLLASAATSIAGITLWHFWIGLILLGVGWNFGFHRCDVHGHPMPSTARAQSGPVLQRFPGLRLDGGRLLRLRQYSVLFGWATVNEVVFPVVLAAGAMLLWLVLRGPAPERLDKRFSAAGFVLGTTKVSKKRIISGVAIAQSFLAMSAALSGAGGGVSRAGPREKRGRAGAISRRNSPNLGFHQ